MKKEWLVFVLFLLGGSLYLFYVSRFTAPPRDLLGQPAPLFTATGLVGTRFDLKEELGKKVVLVNFWATYCVPCREEMPLLNALNNAMDPNWFTLVSIAEDEAEDREELTKIIERFHRQVPFDFEVYGDKDFLIADRYGTFQIPESYLIDMRGKVVHILKGPVTAANKAELMEKIRALEPSPGGTR
jgi:cytochrome c biogenesis protein CcmG/thiol:disulfide interchange protein DsbE